MKNGTLHYVKRATKLDHGSTGSVYHHNFGTGWQNLVFPSDQAAERWAKSNQCEFKGPKNRSEQE